MFPYVAMRTGQSTRLGWKHLLRSVDSRYSEFVLKVIERQGQCASTTEALEMIDEMVKSFARMLVETFDEHCNLRLYALKYHLHEPLIEN